MVNPKVKPEIQYVEKIIEKVIEKPIIMKQIVETPSQPNVLCDLFNNIYFEFDKTEITPKAATIIDEIAQIMLTDTSKNISSQDVLMQKDHHNTIWIYPKNVQTL